MKVNASLTVHLPSQFEVEKALLGFLHHRRDWIETRNVYGPLAQAMGLTAVQRHVLLTGGPEPAWENLVRWARQRLANQEWLDRSRDGYWRLTPLGHAEAHKRESFDPDAAGL